LLSRKVDLETRDIGDEPLTVAELDALIGKRDYTSFLNTRNELYRERNMKQNPPSRAEALELISKNPNLIRRPILRVGAKMALGFDEKEWKELLGA
jgi:arsenate reductase-like glutaredoxin family protein